MVKGKGTGSRRVPSTGSQFLVLLEEIREQNKATIEAVFSLEQKMDRRFEDLERRLTLRIEALEIAVRKNSEDIAALQARVDSLAAEMHARPSPEQLQSIEERVARLEKHLRLAPLA
ncbi:MAG: hypothetical protein ACT4TC_23900 [Myxococcaceae bacterium]